ncbi:hypothetical protein LUX33_19000 [Actinomadura madurae]|uniref:hypothetical protein n=1 Tax=Actinomadura madurae TaxID=1993 RepID=UPI0020D1FFFE|nr:hypothetical protein [Actinomadura madurae]MCP9950284.1 hypothetical protein [Actinomadura madurae]
MSFDVGSLVRGPGRYAFAITNQGTRSAASVHSRESGNGPRLVLRTRPGEAAPSPTTAPSASSTSLPEPAPEPTWDAPGPAKTPKTSLGGGRTLCGLSLELQPGETFQKALTRLDGTYGGLETVRLFYRGVPPGVAGQPRHREPAAHHLLQAPAQGHPRRQVRQGDDPVVRDRPPRPRRLLGLLPRARGQHRRRRVHGRRLPRRLAPPPLPRRQGPATPACTPPSS